MARWQIEWALKRHADGFDAATVEAVAKAIYEIDPTRVVRMAPGERSKMVKLPWEYKTEDFGDVIYIGPYGESARSEKAKKNIERCVKFAVAALNATQTGEKL
jgi:hypothetical protein